MRDRAGLEAEAIEDIGETGRIRSPRSRRGSAGRDSAGRGSGRGGKRGSGQARGSARDAGDGAVQPAGQEAGTRRRRRTRAGHEVGGEQQAQRLGRRGKAVAGGGNVREEDRLEETRRKAS